MSPSDDPAARLIAQFAEQAEFIDGGAFSIDPQAARKKLGGRMLASPRAWILFVIEVAELLAVDQVELRARPTGFGVRLLGVNATSLALGEELSELFTWVFTDLKQLDGERARIGRARQLLALAINAALALPVRSIALSIVTAESGTRMVLQPDSDGVVGPIEAGPPALELRFDSGGVSVEPLRELALVVERCGWGRVPITVLGREVPPKQRADQVRARMAIPLGARNVAVAEITLDRQSVPSAVVIANGVAIETLPLPGWVEGFRALIYAGYERDLSLEHAIRDAAFSQIFAQVRAVHDHLVATMLANGEQLAYSTAQPAAYAQPQSNLSQMFDSPDDSIGHNTAWAAFGLGSMAVVTLGSSPVLSAVLLPAALISGGIALYYLRMRKVFGDEG